MVIYGSLVWTVCNPAAPAVPRGIPGLSPDTHNYGVDTSRDPDEDPFLKSDCCSICKGPDSADDDQIVLCDGCDLGFHQACHEPEGAFLFTTLCLYRACRVNWVSIHLLATVSFICLYRACRVNWVSIHLLATVSFICRSKNHQLQSDPAPPVGSQHSCQPTVKLHKLPLVWLFPLGKG